MSIKKNILNNNNDDNANDKNKKKKKKIKKNVNNNYTNNNNHITMYKMIIYAYKYAYNHLLTPFNLSTSAPRSSSMTHISLP